MNEIGIVLCYQLGTSEMLEIALENIARYTDKSLDYRIHLVYCATGYMDADLSVLKHKISQIPLPKSPYSGDPLRCSWVHGWMLDTVIPRIDAKYIMTLDSDCFPVAEGWLSELYEQVQKPDVGCVGISRPWSPTPPSFNSKSMAYEIWQHNTWDSTHVACQMWEKERLLSFNIGHRVGPDTGVLIPIYFRKMGYNVFGYRPSRSPFGDGEFDPEFNRSYGVIYGDKVYHHAGYSTKPALAEEYPDVDDGSRHFDEARRRVMEERSAAWMLEEGNSHIFKFDREEDGLRTWLWETCGVKP